MVTKKKGFSLVELICTMTIAAIVTVAVAPNVSAYVRNSKLQNYRTALDNVVSELQIGLPQNRYWNWQEAHESAEEILRSDSGRSVTRTDDTYTLSNVSNDSDIQFEVKLDFTSISGQNSQKNVTISGKCLDFDTVTAYGECTVSLKGNAVDAAGYPTIVQETHTYDRSGWFTLLEDRVKSYGEWKDAFKTEEFKRNDFGTPFWTDDNAVYLNTTDYPANSVTDITFMMKRYCITGPANGNVEGVWSNDGNVYTHVPVYPIVQLEVGVGTGGQYKACGENFQNVEVLVGLDESNDDNWVKYDDVFNSDHFPKAEGYTDPSSPAGRYIAWYGDYVKYPGGNYTKYEPIVKYRVHLHEQMNTADQKYSRGWIFVGGMGGGENVQPYADASGIYQGINVKVNIPEYKNELADLVENQQQWDSGSERYFDITGLTPIPGETDTYRDEYGNKILYNKTGDTVTKYSGSIPISVFYGTADEKIETVSGRYVCRRFNKVYIDGINGNEGIIIKKDGQGYYFEKWENNAITKTYLPSAPEGFHWSEGWKWFDADSNGAYTKLEYDYYLTSTETSQVNAHFNRIVPYKNGKFYLNLEESGYGVGDIVKLQFKNIDVDLLANCAESYGGNSFITMYTKSVYEAGGSHLKNHVFYNSANADNIKNGVGLGKVIRDYVNGTVTMYIMMEWDDYPYLAFNYEGAYAGFDPKVDINIDWAVKNSSTSIVTVEEFMPMITVTGDADYAVLTFDWSKCDYITSSNIGNMALEFSKTLNIEVYDKEYNRLSYNASSNRFSPSLLGITSQKNTVMADKLVHIYCYGISADDLTYTVVNAPEPPSV